MTKPTGKPKGRPKGSKTIKVQDSPTMVMKKYRDRLLNSPQSKYVIESIFNAALDNDHKHQAVAWKLIADRILPIGGFDKEAGSSPRNAIQVNITGVPGVEIKDVSPEDGT